MSSWAGVVKKAELRIAVVQEEKKKRDPLEKKILDQQEEIKELKKSRLTLICCNNFLHAKVADLQKELVASKAQCSYLDWELSNMTGLIKSSRVEMEYKLRDAQEQVKSMRTDKQVQIQTLQKQLDEPAPAISSHSTWLKSQYGRQNYADSDSDDNQCYHNDDTDSDDYQ
jgi:septal ring factor EnvC (AmiA/AmiB activator)